MIVLIDFFCYFFAMWFVLSCEKILQAFAWFSDLLVEHAEIFWSLFAVDMDRVLSEQSPDTWDSFPLFQILNDYLRTDGKLKRFLYEAKRLLDFGFFVTNKIHFFLWFL